MLYHSMFPLDSVMASVKSFIHYLIIIVGSTVYVNYSGRNQLAVRYASITIALVMFVGILVFQLADVTGITQCLKKKYNNMRDTQWKTARHSN